MRIKEVQQRLNDMGYSLGEDGILGPKTTAAVKAFQGTAGLKPDGIIGPDTIRALGMTPPIQDRYRLRAVTAKNKTLALRSVEYAIGQNGIREQTDNSGPAVDAFLAEVGLGPGYAWCMAFVYWNVQQAAGDLGVCNPLVRTGGVMRQWNETKVEKVTSNPRPGDIFVMDLGGGAGHTGFVVDITDDTIKTVEGNTNDNGSANGDGVYMRERRKDRIKGYIRMK